MSANKTGRRDGCHGSRLELHARFPQLQYKAICIASKPLGKDHLGTIIVGVGQEITVAFDDESCSFSGFHSNGFLDSMERGIVSVCGAGVIDDAENATWLQ